MSIEDDGRAVELGFIAAVDAENFIAIFVLTLVVDSGAPRAVTDTEVGFTVVVAVATHDGTTEERSNLEMDR